MRKGTHRKSTPLGSSATNPLDEVTTVQFGVRLGPTHCAAVDAAAKAVFGTSRNNRGQMIRLIVNEWYQRKKATISAAEGSGGAGKAPVPVRT